MGDTRQVRAHASQKILTASYNVAGIGAETHVLRVEVIEQILILLGAFL